MTNIIDSLFYPLLSALPGVIRMIVLVIIAFSLASLLRKLTLSGLNKIQFSQKLQEWGVIKPEDNGQSLIKTLGQLVYFLVILFFLPSILSGLNISSTVDPISSMFEKFFAFIPNMIAAGLILFVGTFFCKFIKGLLTGVLERLDIDTWYAKVTGQEKLPIDTKQLISVLSTVVYVLIFIPILTLALETLGITSISQPIVTILNQVIGILPHVLVALVLIAVGSFVAKLIGNLLENLLETAGINAYSKYLFTKEEANFELSAIITQVVRAIIIVFFFIQAIQVLNLEVFNAVGSALLGYLPSLISAIAIVILAIIASNLVANFLQKVTDSPLVITIVRYLMIVFAVFMALDQLKFAQHIVQSTFTIILGALAVAFALAFGLGGREFAARQLEKLEKKIDKE
ncbi:TPA: mechanosensitive ion channel [Streptococcus suis]|nr:mechanosensitive ion channel [Streptococcus suis]NRG98690.1 mechanosensitive ion channel [Streptococcus suis]HEM5989311.1 mechanosensitive ion channel [Streptococcus suis]HEM5997837.1 mechanosensitive ion channel [Streptococcus suis]HEM6083583.1 mechanosensitive ion channel [Streptococcus suis]